MSKHGKALVAMSGGIDSTMTAVMLHEEGWEVIGITMKTWDYATSGGSKKETGCCSLDSINDARQVAVHLGFHHFIVDIREEFGDFVIDNFVDEYMAGRTPNPCVLCNTHIKWASLLRRADRPHEHREDRAAECCHRMHLGRLLRDRPNGRAASDGNRSRDDDRGPRDDNDGQRIDYAVLPPAISSDDGDREPIRSSADDAEETPKPRRRVRRPRADEGDTTTS